MGEGEHDTIEAKRFAHKCASDVVERGKMMEIPVIVEKLHGNGFRARASMPESLSIEGPSRDAVLTGMRDLLQEKLAEVEVVRLDVSVPGEENPWLAVAGMWKDNADALEAEEYSRQYRQQVDADPERP
ncbi:MAG TPA: hypothetical protein VNX28_12060 [Gemmataceae bacterium]|nr:hypothetical protein [Gemmataceae bacterium]